MSFIRKTWQWISLSYSTNLEPTEQTCEMGGQVWGCLCLMWLIYNTLNFFLIFLSLAHPLLILNMLWDIDLVLLFSMCMSLAACVTKSKLWLVIPLLSGSYILAPSFSVFPAWSSGWSAFPGPHFYIPLLTWGRMELLFSHYLFLVLRLCISTLLLLGQISRRSLLTL